MSKLILSRAIAHVAVALYVLGLLALALLCAGTAHADGGQNTGAVIAGATTAAPAALTGNYIGAAWIFGLALLHVLATQAQHWKSATTMASIVTGFTATVDKAVAALQTSVPATVSVPNPNAPTQAAPPAGK